MTLTFRTTKRRDREGHEVESCPMLMGLGMLAGVLLERMKDAVDLTLRDNQAGFWKNRSCADQIASLRIIK